MKSWLALSILILVSVCKASVFSSELDNQKKEGTKKVNTTEELVRKEVEEVNREINKVSLYFSRAINESTIEGKKIYDTSTQKVEKTIIEKFEESIGKDKDIMVLLYLLETSETTKNELDGRYDISKSCLKNAIVQKSNELQKLKSVFEFTEKFSTEFYDGLRTKIKNCKTQECIKQLVLAAETKMKVLIDMFKKYVKEMADICPALQERHRHCMRDAQKNYSEVLKKFENELEYIPKTQGTDGLTDRFDSLILEL